MPENPSLTSATQTAEHRTHRSASCKAELGKDHPPLSLLSNPNPGEEQTNVSSSAFPEWLVPGVTVGIHSWLEGWSQKHSSDDRNCQGSSFCVLAAEGARCVTHSCNFSLDVVCDCVLKTNNPQMTRVRPAIKMLEPPEMLSN